MPNSQVPIIVSSSPHIHSGASTSRAMWEVSIALVPAIVAALYYYRLKAALVILTCVVSAVVWEALCQKIRHKALTIADGSAALTGLLLALCLPASLPWGLCAFGTFCAIVIAKHAFGGLGSNIFNPAHLGRAILLASFPMQMTAWTAPEGATDAVTHATQAVDAVTSATPLALYRINEALWSQGTSFVGQLPSLWDLFRGCTAGCLGETCVPALLLGGLFLIYRGTIDWRIPCCYIATFALCLAGYAYVHDYHPYFTLYHLMSGGLLIGAFFMATDWVTSPITHSGKVVFGLGLGLLTALVRLKGSYCEGVCYAILVMNMFVPLIDRYFINVPFDGRRRKAHV